MRNAITRAVSPCLGDCQLTYMAREPIDVKKAMEEQRAYERALEAAGVRVISLPAEPALPDAVFVQDNALILDEVAVIASMRPPARRAEIESVAAALAPLRQLKYINHSGTLEAGDLVRIGRTLYLGLSSRTNRSGLAQLREIVAPFDYEVVPVEVKECLHLTTGCSYIGRDTLLANRAWVDVTQFRDVRVLDVAEGEPWAANTVLINELVLMPNSFPRTRELLSKQGFRTETVDISELAKAEGGLSCLSIIF